MQESWNKQQPYQRSLSIRSSPDGYSFCYSTAKGKIYKSLKIPTHFDFPERFEDYVQSRGWAENENLQVTFIDFSDHFMLLPGVTVEEEQIRTFFHFQFQQDEESQIFTVPLHDGKQLFCWAIPSSRDRVFEQLFPQLTMLSSAYLLANWTILQASERQRPIIVSHLYGKTMHVFAADAQRLVFANTFPIKDTQEMPYFLIRCMEQLAFDPIHTQFVFCTESIPEDDIIRILSPYIKRIEMAIFTHDIDEPLQIIE